MNHPPSGRIVEMLVWLIAAGMFGFLGLVFTLFGSYEVYKGMKTSSWPSVDGTILSSSMEKTSRRVKRTNGSSGRKTSYHLNVAYAYEVNQQKYENDRFSYGTESYRKLSKAKEALARYPKGKRVPVFYDPDNPSHSVLTRGTGTSWIAIVLGGLGLLLAFLILLYVFVWRN